MKIQNYQHHIRYYAPHHFVFYPVTIALLIISIRAAVNDTENRWLWISISGLWLTLIWLSFMLRQHYALTCQNRIVRLEMRFRYFALTGQRFEKLESHFSFGQIAALRFASDEELPELINKVFKEQLTPDQIKQSVKNWVTDDMRV